jgi:uncharacterized protein (DUF58 family)
MSLPSPTWDPAVLGRIVQLELRARSLVRGFLHGAHASTRVTSNVEFADYKEYSPGDPLRDLDWRVMARADRLVVRRHRAEDELACTIVVDASGDLATGATGHRGLPPLDGSKWGVAVVLAATFAQWAARRNEPVGLAVLGGEDVPFRWLPPRTGRPHLARIHGVLGSVRPSGRAELGEGLARLGPRVRRRSLVVVVSDLMEEPASWGPALDAFGARGADVRVLHVHDPAEWRFEVPGPARYRSPEGGELVQADHADVQAQIGSVLREYLAEVDTWLSRARGVRIPAPSDGDLSGILGQLLRGAA